MSWDEDRMEDLRREHFPRQGSIESLRKTTTQVQDFPEIEETWYDREYQKQMEKYFARDVVPLQNEPVKFEGIISKLRRAGAQVASMKQSDFWKHYDERMKQYPLKPEECTAPPVEAKPTNIVKPVYNIGETPQMWVDWMNGDIPVRMGTPPIE